MCRHVSCYSVANPDRGVKARDDDGSVGRSPTLMLQAPSQLNKPSNSPILVFPKNLPVFVDEIGGGGF